MFGIGRLFSHLFAESFPELTSNLSLTAKTVTVNLYVTYSRMVWEQLAVVEMLVHCVEFCHH